MQHALARAPDGAQALLLVARLVGGCGDLVQRLGQPSVGGGEILLLRADVFHQAFVVACHEAEILEVRQRIANARGAQDDFGVRGCATHVHGAQCPRHAPLAFRQFLAGAGVLGADAVDLFFDPCLLGFEFAQEVGGQCRLLLDLLQLRRGVAFLAPEIAVALAQIEDLLAQVLEFAFFVLNALLVGGGRIGVGGAATLRRDRHRRRQDRRRDCRGERPRRCRRQRPARSRDHRRRNRRNDVKAPNTQRTAHNPTKPAISVGP